MFNKILLAILFMGAACCCARAQYLSVEGCPDGWVYLNPWPDNRVHEQIFRTKIGLVAEDGSQYEMLRSRDSGKTWERFYTFDTTGKYNFPLSVGNLQFVNDSVGFFLDGIWISETTDCGRHWFDNGGYAHYSLTTVTSNFWWEEDEQGMMIYTTTDAGKDWNAISPDTGLKNRENYSIFFLDSLHGWVTVYHSGLWGWVEDLFRTHDGGKTWLENVVDSAEPWTGIPSSPDFPAKFKFIDSSHGYGASWGAHFVYSDDGGVTWHLFAHPLSQYDSTELGMWSVDSSRAVSVADYYIDSTIQPASLNILYGVTTDNGKTWQRDTMANITGTFTFLGCGMAAVIGDGNLVVITDNGKTWNTQNMCQGCTLGKMFFWDKSNGFSISNAGMYQTHDGGRHWELYFSFSGGLYYYSHPTPSTFWFCGDSLVIRTRDGGKTYQWVTDLPWEFYNPYSIDPGAIDFADSLHGWAFSKWDGIWNTTDGGATWMQQRNQILPNGNWFSMFLGSSMIDSLYGWFVGDVILRTTNGGAKWDTMNIPNDLWIVRGIQFISRQHGYLYGFTADTESTAETTDGGATWHNIPIGGGDLHFRDSLFGWVGGFVTTNGGKTWLFKGCNLNPLYSWWADTSEGWELSWNDGSFYHYGKFDSVTVGVAAPPLLPPAAPSALAAYPNPFSTLTTIDLSGIPAGLLRAHANDGSVARATLRVYNMLGVQVADLTPLLNGQQTIEFDASALPPGVYVVKGNFGAKQFVEKVAKFN